MNILMFLGGNCQKFTKEIQKFSDLRKSAIAKPNPIIFPIIFSSMNSLNLKRLSLGSFSVLAITNWLNTGSFP
jgi:hypothetical protein